MLRSLGFILGAVRSHREFGIEKTEVLKGADSTHSENLQLRIPDGRLSALPTILLFPRLSCFTPSMLLEEKEGT